MRPAAHARPTANPASALRVVHLNTERTWRGGEQQTLYLCQGLVARGHDVWLIAPPDSPLLERAAGSGITCVPVRMRGEADPVAVIRLGRLLRKIRPDIVHMHTSHAHSLGTLASLMARHGRRIVSRRVDFSIHRHRFSLSGLKYRLGIDRYIAISRAIKDAMIEDGIDSERITVVHSGIDPARLQGADPSHPRADWGCEAGVRIIGTVAHFGWHKGLEYLIRAAAQLPDRLRPFKVVLVGDGQLRPRIEAERRACGMESVVHLAGFRADVADCLAAFDLFVMPSLMEGLCTSILDALALARPVIASRVGGIPEIIDDGRTGRLVPPRDARALAAAITELLTDREQATRLARAGAALVREAFSVDSMVEGNIAVYREVLAASGRAQRPVPGDSADD